MLSKHTKKGWEPRTLLPRNLEALFLEAINLDILDTPFTHEEIDNVVKSLPADKAPGPVGTLLHQIFMPFVKDFREETYIYRASIVPSLLFCPKLILPLV